MRIGEWHCGLTSVGYIGGVLCSQLRLPDSMVNFLVSTMICFDRSYKSNLFVCQFRSKQRHTQLLETCIRVPHIAYQLRHDHIYSKSCSITN